MWAAAPESVVHTLMYLPRSPQLPSISPFLVYKTRTRTSAAAATRKPYTRHREKCLQLDIPKSPCGIPVSVVVHDCHFCAPVAGQTGFLPRKLTPYAYCLTERIPLALTMLNGDQTVLYCSDHGIFTRSKDENKEKQASGKRKLNRHQDICSNSCIVRRPGNSSSRHVHRDDVKSRF